MASKILNLSLQVKWGVNEPVVVSDWTEEDFYRPPITRQPRTKKNGRRKRRKRRVSAHREGGGGRSGAPGWLCDTEVAVRLGVSRDRVHAMVRQGLCPPPRTIDASSRWSAADLQRWMDAHPTRSPPGATG